MLRKPKMYGQSKIYFLSENGHNVNGISGHNQISIHGRNLCTDHGKEYAQGYFL